MKKVSVVIVQANPHDDTQIADGRRDCRVAIDANVLSEEDELAGR